MPYDFVFLNKLLLFYQNPTVLTWPKTDRPHMKRNVEDGEDGEKKTLSADYWISKSRISAVQIEQFVGAVYLGKKCCCVFSHCSETTVVVAEIFLHARRELSGGSEKVTSS